MKLPMIDVRMEGDAVETVFFSADEGGLLFTPRLDNLPDDLANPYRRQTALRDARAMAEALLRYFDEHPNG